MPSRLKRSTCTEPLSRVPIRSPTKVWVRETETAKPFTVPASLMVMDVVAMPGWPPV